MKSLRLLFILCFISVISAAQDNDAGLWLSYKMQSDFTKKLSWSLAPEVRFQNNISEVGSYFADAGLDYSLPGPWSVSLTYRTGYRNRDSYFSFRQRAQLGVSYKIKFKWGDISLATRYQGNLEGSRTDRDADFVTTWRNKISIKYDAFKKWELGLSYEFFHSKGDTYLLEWSDWRCTASVERKLNKRNFLSLGYLVQQNLTSSVPQFDYIVLVAYKHKLKKRKKQDDPEEK